MIKALARNMTSTAGLMFPDTGVIRGARTSR